MRIYVHGWWAATAIIYLGLVFGRVRIDIETNIDGSSVRDDSARARAERHLYKSFDRARRLAAAFADLGDEQRDAALDFFALTCRAYDSYLEDWARHHAPRNGAGRLLARHALPLRESVTDFLRWDPDHNDAHAVFDALTRADYVAAAAALGRLVSLYESALGYRDGSVAWDGVDDAIPPRITFLERQCAPRRACSKPGGAKGILVVYARELCARSFADDVLASPFLFRDKLHID